MRMWIIIKQTSTSQLWLRPGYVHGLPLLQFFSMFSSIFQACSQAFLPLKGHWFSRIISFYLLSTLPLGPYPPLPLTSTNGWILNLDLSRPFCVLIRLSQVPFVCCVATPMLCFWSPAPATSCRRQFLGLHRPLCKDLSGAFIPENVSLGADHS